MKKLTTLQILMLMSLSLGSSNVYSKFVAASLKDQEEIARHELQSMKDEHATLDVVQDLALTNPEVVEMIVEDLVELEANFNSIKNFVQKKNKEIDKLLQANSVAETEVARLAVELANAQAMLEKTLAQQKAKNKHHHKKESQIIQDALMKAEQGLKLLNNMVVNGMQKMTKPMSKPRNAKAHKNQMRASSQEYQAAQQARSIPGVEAEVAKRLAETNNISEDEAHDIINNAFASDSMDDDMNDQDQVEIQTTKKEDRKQF